MEFHKRNAAMLTAAILGVGATAGGGYIAFEAATNPVLQHQATDAHADGNSDSEPAGGGTASSTDTHQQDLMVIPAPAKKAAPRLAVVKAQAPTDPDDETSADAAAAYTGDNTGNVENVPANVMSANTQYVAAAKAAPVTAIKPNRVLIPSLGILASVIPEKVTNGFLTIPQQNWRAAWYDQSAPLAAASGNTVVAGHVGLGGVRGVFTGLSKLTIGDVIYTSDSTGKVTAWRVSGKHAYGKHALPDSVFYPAAQRMLTLITCGGAKGTVQGPTGSYYGYQDNEVIQAVPVATT